jgi:hypothetical protein
MKKSNMPSETLAGMYHTDIPFLESNSVPVIKRKFNFIPTGGKGDPPRALTDEPPLKTMFYDQHAVKSDFPKTMAYRMYGEGFKQFPDGTYGDAVLALDEDYVERQKALKQVFAPSDVYMFMRADRENYAQDMMQDYFRSKYEEREEREEMFLRNYGLLPHEVKTVMSQRKVEAAAKALENARTSTKIPVQRMGLNIRKEDMIASRFMDNSIPLMSADDSRGAGNAQPLARGHENWTRGYDETSPYANKTKGAASREQRRKFRVSESIQMMRPVREAVTESVVAEAADEKKMMNMQKAEEFDKQRSMKRAMAAMREVKNSMDAPTAGGAGGPAMDEERVVAIRRVSPIIWDNVREGTALYNEIKSELGKLQMNKARAEYMSTLVAKYEGANKSTIRAKFGLPQSYGKTKR